MSNINQTIITNIVFDEIESLPAPPPLGYSKLFLFDNELMSIDNSGIVSTVAETMCEPLPKIGTKVLFEGKVKPGQNMGVTITCDWDTHRYFQKQYLVIPQNKHGVYILTGYLEFLENKPLAATVTLRSKKTKNIIHVWSDEKPSSSLDNLSIGLGAIENFSPNDEIELVVSFLGHEVSIAGTLTVQYLAG